MPTKGFRKQFVSDKEREQLYDKCAWTITWPTFEARRTTCLVDVIRTRGGSGLYYWKVELLIEWNKFCCIWLHHFVYRPNNNFSDSWQLIHCSIETTASFFITQLIRTSTFPPRRHTHYTTHLVHTNNTLVYKHSKENLFPKHPTRLWIPFWSFRVYILYSKPSLLLLDKLR